MSTIVTIENDFANLALLATLVALAGIIGNTFGYWFGSKSGYYLYNKEDTFWFKKKYLVESRIFFEKHGGRAIIFARFVPIIRTFAPIIAGIVGMEKKKFMFFNILSSILWSFSLIFAGHYLNDLFMLEFGINLKDHIEIIVLVIVAITTVPLLLNYLKKKTAIKEDEKEL